MHWATPLIGKPWSPHGLGPDYFSCWGLVRWVFLHQHNMGLPDVTGDDSVQMLHSIATATKWAPVPSGSVIQIDDVIVFNSALGRHVGVIIKANGILGVLHSSGFTNANGHNTGCVIFEALPSLMRTGYHDYELWRHTA